MYNRILPVEDSDFSVRVNIPKQVFDRIYRTVKNSDVEEGGKFVGKVNYFGDLLSIDIVSYLDSGHKASKSKTHIIPDGEYQENLFRLIEIYDKRIEHIGTWHSHHCNKLDELSGGDERGYFDTVNKSNYNLNCFFALLVTGITPTELKMKYFLFRRSDGNYYQLNPSNINLVPISGKIPRILTFMETLNQFNSRYIQGSILTQKVKRKIPKEDSRLSKLRAIDNKWIRTRFRNVITKKNKLTNVISWHWMINGRNNRYSFIYSHPPFLGRIRKIGSLKVFFNESRIRKVKIPLNSKRFEKIVKVYNKLVLQ